MPHREPITTTDSDGREWVHPEALRFYLYQSRETQLWCILDRDADLAVTKQHKTRRGAWGQFLRDWQRTKGHPEYYR